MNTTKLTSMQKVFIFLICFIICTFLEFQLFSLRKQEIRETRETREMVFLNSEKDATTKNLDFEVPKFIYSKDMDREQIELIAMNNICYNTKHDPRGEPIIQWVKDYTNNNMSSGTVRTVYADDEQLKEIISDCPDVDVYIPVGLRGYGYCEDSMGFIKYLNGRGLPEWIFKNDTKNSKGDPINYFELCPQTPVIFLNHYWDEIPSRPEWPKTKSVYLMPNIEMQELSASHLRRADLVICRTKVCESRVLQWYKLYGNTKGVPVFYSGGISSDVTAHNRLFTEQHLLKPKDFSKYIFLHTPGTSYQKGTTEVFECWKKNPSFPLLRVYSNNKWVEERFTSAFNYHTPQNVILNTSTLNTTDFGALFSEPIISLCPSRMEGFGHYINQARAATSFVITTDAPPMNEFVDETSGALLPVSNYAKNPTQLLGRDYHGEFGLHHTTSLEVDIRVKHLCDTVHRVLKLPPAELSKRALMSRIRYERDSTFFRQRMNDLAAITREIRHNNSMN